MLLSLQNRESAELFGWDPTWWSMMPDEWGLPLEAQIAAFQGAEGIAATGYVDELTFRRLVTFRTLMLAPDDELEAEELAGPPEVSDHIIVDGKRLPIPWQRVVTMDEEGGHAIERYYKNPKTGKQSSRFGDRKWGLEGTTRVGFHWTATRSAASTWKYAWSQRRSVSTHFEIDWDGTIYQLVDVVHATYNYGASWMNHSCVGVDLTNAVAVGNAKAMNEKLVKLG